MPSDSMAELYQELPQGAWIRVLELLPGQGDESIACRYRLANLGTDPEYEAISYVWGDPSNRGQVMVVNDAGKSKGNISGLRTCI